MFNLSGSAVCQSRGQHHLIMDGYEGQDVNDPEELGANLGQIRSPITQKPPCSLLTPGAQNLHFL